MKVGAPSLSRMRSRLYLCIFPLLVITSWVCATEPQLLEGNARVVLVGDSITGLSRNYATGFAHQMDWALKQAYPACKPDIVALGGSGQGIRSWLSVEKRSRTDETYLDVKGIEVKGSLAQPADVLVIMLGMNDVLAPYVNDEPASIEAWAEGYRKLITNLQARAHPKVTALATATLCTEDLDSPKNRMIDKLNARATQLARELHLLVLPTNATVREVLKQGRLRKPDFHVTYDFVHPNEPGHIAVAIGMLKGLGETKAAMKLADERMPKAIDKAAGPLPCLSYQVEPLPAVAGKERQSFRIRCSLVLPQGPASTQSMRVSAMGGEVRPVKLGAMDAEFDVAGLPDRWVNELTLEASFNGQLIIQKIHLPAPWLVASGIPRPFWNGQKLTFDETKARGPIDEAIEQGRDFTKLPGVSWQRYYPSVNFTGGQASGSVDFAEVNHAKVFEGGYAARWIYSDHDRPVSVDLSVQAFAGNTHLGVHLNGSAIYSGVLTSEPKRHKVLDARLRKGWNALVCTSSHMQWQWQHAVDVQGLAGDTLDDLRFSAVPQVDQRQGADK